MMDFLFMSQGINLHSPSDCTPVSRFLSLTAFLTYMNFQRNCLYNYKVKCNLLEVNVQVFGLRKHAKVGMIERRGLEMRTRYDGNLDQESNGGGGEQMSVCRNNLKTEFVEFSEWLAVDVRAI